MNFWQTFFGVSKGQVCTFACTSIIDFRAFRMPGKTILQHNINQPGPLSDHPKRDIIYRVTRTATVSVSTDLRVKHKHNQKNRHPTTCWVPIFFVKKQPHSTVLQGGFSQPVQSALVSRLSK